MRKISRPPFPGGPEYTSRKGFHHSRRDVNQETENIAARNGLQMVTYRIYVPPVDVGVFRLDYMPGLLNELPERNFRQSRFQDELVGDVHLLRHLRKRQSAEVWNAV